MKVADSSFLVALFLPEDINHEKAKEIFKNEDLLLVPEDIVKETLTVIMYKKGVEYTKEIWNFISNSEVFEIVREEYSKLVNFYLSLNKKISYFDSCIIYFSLTNNVEPVAFDKQLIKIWNNLKKQ